MPALYAPGAWRCPSTFRRHLELPRTTSIRPSERSPHAVHTTLRAPLHAGGWAGAQRKSGTRALPRNGSCKRGRIWCTLAPALLALSSQIQGFALKRHLRTRCARVRVRVWVWVRVRYDGRFCACDHSSAARVPEGLANVVVGFLEELVGADL